jgi:two-component system, chemotaxis family, protein-glutamate methylesterase/glutaminase
MDNFAPFSRNQQMLGHDIIVVGASAGGVEVLSQLVASLPENLPAAIFIVIHLSGTSKSFLPEILNRKGKMHAAHARDGEAIVPGRIYVAQPNYHLLVKRGYIRLVQGPKENGTRPAIDPLFRTAAKAYDRRVVGVVLSGTLDDGTAGLIDIKQRGGVAVVQHPDDALFSGMPKSAISHVEVDHILPVSAIAPVLVSLAHEPIVEPGVLSVNSDSEREMEPDIVELDGMALRERGHPGTASGLICPDCGGSLFQLHERKNLLQYRCRVGHAFSAESLVAGQYKAQEVALWAAIRSLEERAELMSKMANNAAERNSIKSAGRFEAQAREAQEQADSIRIVLFQNQLPTMAGAAETDGGSNPGEPEFDAALKVVVLAASDGGLNALSHVLAALPLSFPAAIIVVQHLDTQSQPSLMLDLLNHPSSLPLLPTQAGEQLRAGRAYIAPATSHLFVTPNGTLCLSNAVFVDWKRPSADLLLQSVAASFKQRAIAVVLSGRGSDGAMGVQAIHKMGGKVIAQDERTAEFFEMPSAAIATGAVDFVLPLGEIASTINNWANN